MGVIVACRRKNTSYHGLFLQKVKVVVFQTQNVTNLSGNNSLFHIIKVSVDTQLISRVTKGLSKRFHQK